MPIHLDERQALSRNPHGYRLWSEIREAVGAEQRLEKVESYQIGVVMPAVEYEVGRFEYFQKVGVEPDVEDLLSKQIARFGFISWRTWQPEPELHADYTLSMLLSVPVHLREVAHLFGDPQLVNADQVQEWLKGNIAGICPYICPGSQHG
jgi:hypothetical protein